MNINYLDLFAGIGGFSLAAKRAGFNIENHFSSEIDKYANYIYRKHFPGSIQLGDVTKFNNDLGKIDIITGGFPCQAFSIAGKRRGFKDTRGTLFFEIERFCGIYKPSYMVLENVKGLASHEGGDTIRVILDRLRRLNYSVQLLLLNTKDFGIPQNRERFFFICTASGKRQPEISRIRERKTEIAFSANCIDANYYKGIDNHGQRTCIKVGTLRSYKNEPPFREMASPVSPTLKARAREDGDMQPVIIQTPNGCSHDNYTLDDSIIRRLTPIECERLQDYPDNWTQYGIDETGKEIEISDTQRYKCCGNSITVKPAEMIMEEIKKVFSE